MASSTSPYETLRGPTVASKPKKILGGFWQTMSNRSFFFESFWVWNPPQGPQNVCQNVFCSCSCSSFSSSSSRRRRPSMMSIEKGAHDDTSWHAHRNAEAKCPESVPPEIETPLVLVNDEEIPEVGVGSGWRNRSCMTHGEIAYFEENLHSMCSIVSMHGAFQSEENRSRERERGVIICLWFSVGFFGVVKSSTIFNCHFKRATWNR